MTRKPLLPAAAALALASPAWAAPGGTVAYLTYGPLSAGTQAIPTLSQWGLAVLVLALAALAPRLLRSARGGMLRAIALALLTGAALLAVPWSTPAMAQIGMSVGGDDADAALDQPGGGTAQLLWQPALGWGDFYYRYTLQNTSGKPQQIRTTDVRGYRLLNPDGANTCKPGMVLQPDATCTLGLSNPQ